MSSIVMFYEKMYSIAPPKWISFIRVGKLLIPFLILFIYADIKFYNWFLTAYAKGDMWPIIYMGFIFLFSITNTILSIMDVRSRFQNYKKVKDQLFEYGFDTKFVKPFTISKCQRQAIIVAGIELGMKSKIKSYFKESGYRWYHIIPDFVFSHPLFFLHP